MNVRYRWAGNPPTDSGGSGSSGPVVQSVTGNIVDNTDPTNPVITGLDETSGDSRYLQLSGGTLTGPVTGNFSNNSGNVAYGFGGVSNSGFYGTSSAIYMSIGATPRAGLTSGSLRLSNSTALQWSTTSSAAGASDVGIQRTAADALTITASAGVTFTGPINLSSYTVATLPTAALYTGTLVYVSDATGGASPAFSDGTNWISLLTGAAV